jgi:hypothetical protein
MTSSVISPASAPLRRFVTDGIRAALDAHTSGTLPLHRLAWELDARIATLAELTALPHYRTLATLRAAQHTVATLDTTLRTAGRADLTAAEEHSLATAVTTLRTGLARLNPPDPVDPVEFTGHRPVVVAFRRPTSARRAATAELGGGHTAA